MTRRIYIAALAIATIIQGCSDTAAPAKLQPQVVSTAAVEAPAVPIPGLSLGLPESVRGLPFAVGGKCTLDAIGSDREPHPVSVSTNAAFTVYGWAFDDTAVNATVPPVILLQLVRDGKYYHAALARNAERSDVAKVFSNAALVAAGYSGSVGTKDMPPGEYEVLVLQRGPKTNLICPTYRLIRVTA